MRAVFASFLNEIKSYVYKQTDDQLQETRNVQSIGIWHVPFSSINWLYWHGTGWFACFMFTIAMLFLLLLLCFFFAAAVDDDVAGASCMQCSAVYHISWLLHWTACLLSDLARNLILFSLLFTKAFQSSPFSSFFLVHII